MKEPGFKHVTHLTFDCYGTLIDWETGILDALTPLLARHNVMATPEALLRSYVAHEARLEAAGWQPYREVLRGVMSAIARDFNVELGRGEENTLLASLPSWPPFPDTVAALQQLKQHYRLVILSNTDDTLFAQTAKQLEVAFDVVITAEQVRSYKPGEAHFREALRRLNVQPQKVLHVAQSLYHDHVPAQRLGWHTAHIDRPSRLTGTGLAPTATVRPDWVGTDLQSLATALAHEQGKD